MYEWIKPPSDGDTWRSVGQEPRAAAKEYLVRSEDWTVSIGGREETVLAVPVTHGTSHSFVSVPYEAGMEICVGSLFHAVESLGISPRRLGIRPEREAGSLCFVPPAPGHYVVVPEGGVERALTLSLMQPVQKPQGITHHFPAGLTVADPIRLRDGDVVYLERGALVRVKAPDPVQEAPITEKDWAGKRRFLPFILGRDVKNVQIVGEGIIDLSDLDWHERNPLSLSGCRNVLVEGITFLGAPEWTLTLDGCDGVTLRDIRMYGHRENSDGIDICSSSNVLVEKCFIRTGDDCICLKGLRKPPATGGEHILVQDCIVWNDKVRCLGIASETRNDMHDVTFRRCDVIRSLATWTRELGSLCIIVCDQGIMHDIVFEDIWVEQESHYLLNIMIMKDKWTVQKEPGRVEGITFRNIHAPGGVPLNFLGYDEAHLVRDIRVINLTVDGEAVASLDELRVDTNEFARDIRLIQEA